MGPSPRMRGSVCGGWWCCCCVGSIPAYAGFSAPDTMWTAKDRVHPRVCGVQCRLRTGERTFSGPSPRMRGSDCSPCVKILRIGSIPAYAGFRVRLLAAPYLSEVHPRVCGVQLSPIETVGIVPGPSPRMRGSGQKVRGGPVVYRSIPAYAGFSVGADQSFKLLEVHPRVCGVQTCSSATASILTGPSPRMRGSVQSIEATGN